MDEREVSVIGALTVALQTITEILTRYNHHGQAEYVRRLLNAISEGDENYKTMLTSVDMWGGAGAVWESYIPRNETSRTNPDEREFRNAIIEVAKQIQNLGIHFERADQISESFQEWNKRNL